MSTNGCMEEGKYGWLDWWVVDGQTDFLVDSGWMKDGWIDIWVDGWVDEGWNETWMNGFQRLSTDRYNFKHFITIQSRYMWLFS